MKKAIIIGGGPAGLTAAYEFLKYTDVQPTVLEMSEYWGGISRTVNYKGNRIDIGGHRFFSKSDELTKYVSSFPDNAKLFWEPLVATENSRKIGPFTVSNEDLSGFIKEFENYLGNSKLKGLNDTKKFIELIKFSQMELSNFFYGKTK